MRTARAAFFESAARAEFAKMIETTTMDAATEYALLTFIEEMPAESEPNAAWSAHCRMVGAREVLRILKTLHLKQEQQKVYRPPSLTPPK